jgi:hypothetical protein
MNRPHHPALVCEGPGEWSVKEWAHRRDQDRIQAEDWPFDDGPGHWSVPAPRYHPTTTAIDPPHPRSTQARRAARNERYAAQAALYASTVSPPPQATSSVAEPTLTAGGATGDPVADVGYAFHRLMEALTARRRP